jgi:hypothetical protein
VAQQQRPVAHGSVKSLSSQRYGMPLLRRFDLNSEQASKFGI